MFLTKKYEIQSKDTIAEFLNKQDVGRISTIDEYGFPQIIPMNFVFVKQMSNKFVNEDSVYMHSHPKGEKISNILRTFKVGFEVDQHVCFLPSYYFHPSDASQADTLYISVVIKGRAELINNIEEKVFALNCLMEKYQSEGKYERVNKEMGTVREVAIIRIIPYIMKGKYKVGQQWNKDERKRIAKNIILREGKNKGKFILDKMGIEIQKGRELKVVNDPSVI